MAANSTPLASALQPASFRNVPFQVDDSDIGAGRRVQVHEYPQRDKPFVEDLGRATREIRVSGFVIGADYIEQANRLLSAIEQPGSGMLVHPWHGQMRVTLKELGRVRYDRALGYATIEMVFVEAGELEFPLAKPATAQLSALAADDLGNAALADFVNKFNLSNAMDYVIAAAKGDIQRIFQLSGMSSIPGMAALNFAENALSAVSSAIQLISNPRLLGRNILSAFNVFSLLERVSQLGNSGLNPASSVSSSSFAQTSGGGILPSQSGRVGGMIGCLMSASSAYAAPAATFPLDTPAAVQQYTNTVALFDLSRRALLVQAVGLSSVLPAEVHDDVLAVRNALITKLDAEMQTTAAAGFDSVYLALQVARTAVFNDLTARARNGARIAGYTPPQVMPMLAIAEEYYGDSALADEILLRNRIRHPLLVPPQLLKMRVL